MIWIEICTFLNSEGPCQFRQIRQVDMFGKFIMDIYTYLYIYYGGL